VSRNGVCEVLTATLRERAAWDEEPCLYGMYRDEGTVRLNPVLPEGEWPGGPPGATLARLAADVSEFRPDTLTALMSAAFLGVAFRTEVWSVSPTVKPGTDLMAQLRAAETTGPRPSLHPERVEQRFMWAVTRDGGHYMAMQTRGERQIVACKTDAHGGRAPEALERILRAFTVGAN
jgi:hypothetical protein